MNYKFISIEDKDNIGIIKLNRAAVFNAINEEMLYEIAHQLGVYDTNTEINAVIIKGDEKAFAAGIDIVDLSEKQDKGGFILSEYYKSFALIEDFNKPLIAAVSGYALGIGLSLAMCCDIILAADNAQFALPEISIGLIPGFGTTQKLRESIGKAKAAELILSGRALSAEEADTLGLISRVVPLSDIDNEALLVAKQISSFPRIAIEKAKETLNSPQQKIIESGIDTENRNIQYCLSNSDFRESLAAFMEKRASNRKNQ